MENPNPTIYQPSLLPPRQPSFDDSVTDEFDSREIFDLIRSINDPEHPVSLEQLNVVSPDHIYVLKSENENANENENINGSCGGPDILLVQFTPTIPHCSMATLIGLSIQMKLLRSLPPGRFRVHVQIRPGTHSSEVAINRQLADKERVAAAGENTNLRRVLAACLMGPPRSGIAL